MQQQRPSTLRHLEAIICEVAHRCAQEAVRSIHPRPWQSPAVRDLVARRRRCQDVGERSTLSKAIVKRVRRATRLYCTNCTQNILQEFVDLGRLNRVHRAPVVKDCDEECAAESFAIALEAIYSSSSTAEEPCRDHLRRLARFTLGELESAIKQMGLRRCADHSGIVLEMIKYGSSQLLFTLLGLFNAMLDQGRISDDWRQTAFIMIAKSGDLSQASNYRPIAILPVFYKIFSRMIYQRLQNILEGQQCSDQTGFRRGIRIEDAIVVIETLTSRTAEWNMPLWIASLDLRKAFDRIEHGALFRALREQGVDDPELALLLDLYFEQSGTATGVDHLVSFVV